MVRHAVRLRDIMVVVSVAVSWVVSTQIARITLKLKSPAPALLVWYSTIWNIIIGPAYALLAWGIRKQRPDSEVHSALLSSGAGEYLHEEAQPVPDRPFTLKRLTVAASGLYPLWLGANYMYSRALLYMTASNVTVVFSCTPALVFLLSFFILDEALTAANCLAVVFCIMGVALVAISGHDLRLMVAGVLLTLGASVCAASYKVAFKRFAGDNMSAKTLSKFMSIVGLINILPGLAVVLLLQAYNVETFDWSTLPFGLISIHAVAALGFNFLIAFGIALTRPLFISIGTVLGIPLNLLIDCVAHGIAPSVLDLVGALCVGASFMLISAQPDVSSLCFRRRRSALTDGQQEPGT